MNHRWLIASACAAVSGGAIVLACSSSSSSGGPETSDSGSSGGNDSGQGQDTGGPIVDAGPDAPQPTTTIAQARQSYDGGTGPSITVDGVVTAVQGPAGDQVNWYIEDPAGGPYSGIVVYCDPDLTGCPCGASCPNHVSAPPIGTLVSLTGSISTYQGQLQIEPTAQTILQTNATIPTHTVTASDLSETGNSPYRGVYVKFPSTVTVDNLTPAALYDTSCNTTGADGGADGGLPLCSGCAPPTYSGFEVNGPGANAFFVKTTFFPGVNLQNSPECLTQPDASVVTVGETFPSMAGILDIVPYTSDQAISPAQPSDYGQ